MADYNVNMKQWNGTSFDNVLPLAYNAKQLGGQSLAEVKQWVQDNGLMLYTGQYTGTGTYGAKNPVSIQFPFEPKLFIFPISTGNYPASSPLDTSFLTTSYKQVGRTFYVGNNISVYGAALMARFSDSSRKKLQIYSDIDASSQSNESGQIYYFAAIGGYDRGGSTEWVITQSGTWTVPKTGRYMLELYGKGGNGVRNEYRGYIVGSGGASCQAYDEISLSSGDIINIVIDSGRTSFGNYTVNAATSAHWNNGTGTMTAGVGTGNKGANGTYSNLSSSDWPNVYGTGTFSQKYGYGGGAAINSYGTNGGPGAVYIKYLGA